MIRRFTSSLSAAVLLAVSAAAAPPGSEAEVLPQVRQSLERWTQRPRPRLFLGANGFQGLRDNAQTAIGSQVATVIRQNAAHLLATEPQKMKLHPGGDLLRVARLGVYRIVTLSSAYHLTQERQFADRAIREMLAYAAFPSWNPEHFLDVAEMGLAMSLGYDWLYDQLTPEQREIIAEAIYRKLILPSLAEPRPGRWSWVGADNNWNQVCHTGTVAGAIAIFEKDPPRHLKAITRALVDVQPSIRHSYSPDGTYSEGPMYWGYGTDYNSLLLQMLQAAFGTAFELDRIPGFSRTAEYMMQVTTPLNTVYPYADCQARRELNFTPFWAAIHFQRPDFLSSADRRQLAELVESTRRREAANRLMPFALSCLNRELPLPATAPLRYIGAPEAAEPIAIYRTGFDRNAAYLGIKGGTANGPHGHMDVGSFLYARDGVIWADEIQHEKYDLFADRKNLSFWDGSQNSPRFAVFRQGPRAHNLLMIDDARQKVGVKVPIEARENVAELKLDALYAGQAREVRRTFHFAPDGALRIVDRLRGLKPGAQVRFQMLTHAAATPDGDTVTLIRDGKRLQMRLTCSVRAAWQVTACDAIPRQFPGETPAPDARMVEFTATAPAHGELDFTVDFQPLAPLPALPGEAAANWFIFNPAGIRAAVATDPATGSVTVTLPRQPQKLAYYSIGCRFKPLRDLTGVKQIRFLAKGNIPAPLMFGVLTSGGGRLTMAGDRAIRLKPQEFTEFVFEIARGEAAGKPELAQTTQFFIGCFASFGDTAAEAAEITVKGLDFIR